MKSIKVGRHVIPLWLIAILSISGIGTGVLAYHIWQTLVMHAYIPPDKNTDYINKKGLDDFSILCILGGDMYQYAQDISLIGMESIKNFIRNGGGYIGICGGAYFASEKVVWRGNRLPMTSLEVFSGIAEGPINEIVPYPSYNMCKVNIVDSTHLITQSGPDSAWMLYYWGPVLMPNKDANVTILGKYDRGNQPTMLAFDYGLGRVFLIGTHPEIEEDSERDDQGSDWELIRKAVLWSLKKQIQNSSTYF